MIDSILRSDIAGNGILFAASDGDPIDFLGTYSEKYLSLELENNPITKDRIKILFVEDYKVSSAEILIPSPLS